VKIARSFALLVLLLTCFEISQQSVSADDPCQQACSNDYSSCLTSAQEGYDECLVGPQQNYNTCENAADDKREQQYYMCDTFWPYAWCYDGADQGWIDDVIECQHDYDTAEEGCYDQQQTANTTCVNTYNACYNGCPPE
jgi:hypothetical protein